MIIIINGSLGVGKSSVADNLLWRREKSVHLDGDSLCDMNPFEIYDRTRIDNLYTIMEMLTAFHKKNGFENIIINYIFEEARELETLTTRLQPLDADVHVFLLVCDEEIQRQRVKKRGRDNLEWELQRFVELQGILRKASSCGFVGELLDTSSLSVSEVADEIERRIAVGQTGGKTR